jgi:hypothetical protein
MCTTCIKVAIPSSRCPDQLAEAEKVEGGNASLEDEKVGLAEKVEPSQGNEAARVPDADEKVEEQPESGSTGSAAAGI